MPHVSIRQLSWVVPGDTYSSKGLHRTIIECSWRYNNKPARVNGTQWTEHQLNHKNVYILSCQECDAKGTEVVLSFAKVVDAVHRSEAAVRNARQLQISPSTQEVNKVRAREGTNCYRCGRAIHRASQCPMMSALYYNCRKRGHIHAVCQAQPKGQSTQDPNLRNEPPLRRGKVQTVPFDQEVEKTYWLSQIRSRPGRPLEGEARLEEKPLLMYLTLAQKYHWSSRRHFKWYCLDTQHRILGFNCTHIQGKPFW